MGTRFYLLRKYRSIFRERYGDKYKWNYDELSSLFLLKNLNLLKVLAKINHKRHPSENKDKYLQLSEFKKFDIQFSKNDNLAQDISNADIVVGANLWP